MTATETLKSDFAALKPRLPEGWLDQMLTHHDLMSPVEARKLIDRYRKIYVGSTAPSPDELQRFRELIPAPVSTA